jgi:hypothetical protein
MLKEGLSIDTTFNPPQFSSDYTFNTFFLDSGSIQTTHFSRQISLTLQYIVYVYGSTTAYSLLQSNEIEYVKIRSTLFIFGPLVKFIASKAIRHRMFCLVCRPPH